MSITNMLSVDWSTIPAPTDDGAALHLTGKAIPSVVLPATDGTVVDLSNLEGTTVIYAYPMTARPGVPMPDDWDMIPGARGCTPQSCAFRDHNAELQQLGVRRVFGLSTQTTDYQRECVDRLCLPFAILSDSEFKLADALGLPTFLTANMRLLKRLTMIVTAGKISRVFYPVFPPDKNASEVISWLRTATR